MVRAWWQEEEGGRGSTQPSRTHGGVMVRAAHHWGRHDQLRSHEKMCWGWKHGISCRGCSSGSFAVQKDACGGSAGTRREVRGLEEALQGRDARGLYAEMVRAQVKRKSAAVLRSVCVQVSYRTLASFSHHPPPTSQAAICAASAEAVSRTCTWLPLRPRPYRTLCGILAVSSARDRSPSILRHSIVNGAAAHTAKVSPWRRSRIRCRPNSTEAPSLVCANLTATSDPTR